MSNETKGECWMQCKYRSCQLCSFIISSFDGESFFVAIDKTLPFHTMSRFRHIIIESRQMRTRPQLQANAFRFALIAISMEIIRISLPWHSTDERLQLLPWLPYLLFDPFGVYVRNDSNFKPSGYDATENDWSQTTLSEVVAIRMPSGEYCWNCWNHSATHSSPGIPEKSIN